MVEGSELNLREDIVPEKSSCKAQRGEQLSRTKSSQNHGAVPRRARIQGSQTCVSLSARLESD